MRISLPLNFHRRVAVLVFVFFGLLFWHDVSPKQEIIPKALTDETAVAVTRVIDGDTIQLEGGWKVRYIGIDTPESVDPRKPVECFAKEAAGENRRLVEGKIIRLEKDVSEIDKYGRLLRYVYVKDDSRESFVNLELVKQGFAFSWTYPPDVKYQHLFITAQEEAREERRGLWGKCPLSDFLDFF